MKPKNSEILNFLFESNVHFNTEVIKCITNTNISKYKLLGMCLLVIDNQKKIIMTHKISKLVEYGKQSKGTIIYKIQ